MRSRTLIALAALVALAAFACGDDGDKVTLTAVARTAAPSSYIEVGTAAPRTATTSSTASTAGTAVVSPTATQVAALEAPIDDVLSCRAPPVSRVASDNGPLQVVAIDLNLYPSALCNDATPGLISYRPYAGEANRNKWVITLAGGGLCLGGQDCADRWCGVGTNFDADNMSTVSGAAGAPAEGLLLRRDDNPFGNWNQVNIRYCSSDLRTGNGFNTSFTAKDPKTGKDVTYQVHFAGAAIFSAGMSILRKEKSQQLVYTRNNQRVAMPDLDDASDVLFGGGSAGGAGTIFNLDRLADMLKGGANKPVVRGFIDAILSPPGEQIRFESSTACKTYGLCTYEAVFVARAKAMGAVWKGWADQSCIDWHQKNQPGTEWQCLDYNHVLANHVTTPFFVRMNLGDVLVSGNDIDAGNAGADGKVFTRLSWAVAERETLMKLPAAVIAGHEKGAITKSPGVFAPGCVRHYTIFDTDSTFSDTVTVNGKPYNSIAVLQNWMADQKPDAVVGGAALGADKCPGDK